MEKFFRYIVVVSVVLYIGYIFLPYTWPIYYSEEVLNAVSWSGAGAIFQTSDAYWNAIHIAYIIVSIGLLFYKKWARTGFFILTLHSVFISPLYGVFALYGLDLAVSTALILIDGSILTMAYLSSISGRFNGNV